MSERRQCPLLSNLNFTLAAPYYYIWATIMMGNQERVIFLINSAYFDRL